MWHLIEQLVSVFFCWKFVHWWLGYVHIVAINSWQLGMYFTVYYINFVYDCCHVLNFNIGCAGYIRIPIDTTKRDYCLVIFTVFMFLVPTVCTQPHLLPWHFYLIIPGAASLVAFLTLILLLCCCFLWCCRGEFCAVIL